MVCGGGDDDDDDDAAVMVRLSLIYLCAFCLLFCTCVVFFLSANQVPRLG